MSETIATWGYRQGEARIFELPAGGKLPPGWYDSPAKIPPDDPAGVEGEKQVRANPPSAASPPPLFSIEQQEQTEYARLVDENRRLKKRVAELEDQLDVPPAIEPPSPDLIERGLPPVPETAQGPRIGEILDKVDEAEAAGEAPAPRVITPIERARAAKAAKRAREKNVP